MKYQNQADLKNGLARMVLPRERTNSITCVMSSLHPCAVAVILTTAGGLEKGETATHAVDGSPPGLLALAFATFSLVRLARTIRSEFHVPILVPALCGIRPR